MHFCPTNMRLLMLSEEHVHNNLHLGDPFIRLELNELLVLFEFGENESREQVVNTFAILALELDLFVVPTRTMHG